MARDGLFPRGLCTIHHRFQTPANAIIAQAAWAVILMVTGTALLILKPPDSGLPEPILNAWAKLHAKPLYDVLYTYVIFGGTIFYGLAIASVFILRVRRPDLPRPYKTWGYPMTPILYSAASLLLLWSIYHESPFESLAGLAIIAAGIPAYYLFSRGPSQHSALSE
jgi:APA family basic amino acid/polyamine antiporter